MDDIHLFILLFLALVFLCRSTKEGFEETGPGGVVLNKDNDNSSQEMESESDEEDEMEMESESDGETDYDSDEDVLESMDTQEPGLAPAAPASAPPAGLDRGIGGYDSRKVFSSPTAANFGSLLDLKQIEQVNGIFSQRNTNPQVPQGPSESQMPSLSEGASVPNKLNPLESDSDEEGEMPGAGGEVELHMVYAEWCGHSQKALSPFKELVGKKDVKTSSGKTVKFVLTEESSDGFKEFKGKVNGFPTFMVKDGQKLEEVDVGDRSKDAVINAAKKL